MSECSSISTGLRRNCYCGKAASNFVAWTPLNVGRRFSKCSMPEGRKCSYWEWEDDELPPRIVELICKLKKEKDSLRHEKNILQGRMVDLENYVAEGIEKVKENNELKKKVTDLENLLAVDVGLIQKLKDKVFKQWLVIGISWCCFVSLISSWIR